MHTDIKQITDEWYLRIAEQYGLDVAVEAGYFQETKSWQQGYAEIFGKNFLTVSESISDIIQFSGAFFPFHEGHRDILQSAISNLNTDICIFIHVDHRDYRNSKGHIEEEIYSNAFKITNTLDSKYQLEIKFVFEDSMPNGCSRNFTRLYQELISCNKKRKVWFLAGGDRAQFALTFKDKGRCLIIGRDQHSNFSKYKYLKNERIIFLPGNNLISSSNIRNIVG